MKKFASIVVAAMVIQLFSPLIPSAKAAVLTPELTALLLGQDSNIAQVQELLKIRQDIEQANSKVVLDSLTKVAIEKVPNGNLMAALGSGDLNDVAQALVAQGVVGKIAPRLSEYDKELSALSLLLGAVNNSAPKADVQQPFQYSKVLNMTATAYAPGVEDNGEWDTLTYMGGTVRKGVVAVDPKVIPMGSRVWVEGYGEAVAEDQGSAIKGARIDLAFDDRQQALDYGIQDVKVYVLE